MLANPSTPRVGVVGVDFLAEFTSMLPRSSLGFVSFLVTTFSLSWEPNIFQELNTVKFLGSDGTPTVVLKSVSNLVSQKLVCFTTFTVAEYFPSEENSSETVSSMTYNLDFDKKDPL